LKFLSYGDLPINMLRSPETMVFPGLPGDAMRMLPVGFFHSGPPGTATGTAAATAGNPEPPATRAGCWRSGDGNLTMPPARRAGDGSDASLSLAKRTAFPRILQIIITVTGHRVRFAGDH